jgi:hypothetical protein
MKQESEEFVEQRGVRPYDAVQEYEVQIKDLSEWYGAETRINEKFVINKNQMSKAKGHYTDEGYQRYLARSIDNEGYFQELRGGVDLKLSRFSACTAMGLDSTKDDFYQYNAVKLALLSGAINHIDTNHFHRS